METDAAITLFPYNPDEAMNTLYEEEEEEEEEETLPLTSI